MADTLIPQDVQLLALAKELVKERRKSSPSRNAMNEILDDMVETQKHTDVRLVDRRRA